MRGGLGLPCLHILRSLVYATKKANWQGPKITKGVGRFLSTLTRAISFFREGEETIRKQRTKLVQNAIIMGDGGGVKKTPTRS